MCLVFDRPFYQFLPITPALINGFSIVPLASAAAGRGPCFSAHGFTRIALASCDGLGRIELVPSDMPTKTQFSDPEDEIQNMQSTNGSDNGNLNHDPCDQDGPKDHR